MTITVVIARDDVGAPTTREVYAEGAKFKVEGGDLSILSGRPQVLALYGSGNWLSVHVDDFVEVISEKPAEDDSSADFDFGGFGDDDSSSDDSSSDDSSSDDSGSDDFSFGDDDSTTDDAGTDDSTSDDSTTDDATDDATDDFSLGDDDARAVESSSDDESSSVDA